MCKVAESPKKLHILAADDTGTAEKNIINKDLGILDDFGILVEYNGSGTKDDKIPHLLFHAPQGDKTIYVLGYGNKKKWNTLHQKFHRRSNAGNTSGRGRDVYQCK